ncbi:MAG: ROK family protein [Candidatus Accumulibacter sp.]|jgi:polyphosphate glucokinase|nr:ROK family protein [Accumulibacter sp.]
MRILGVDIGGTGMKSGVVDTEKGALDGKRIRVDTPRPATPERVAETLRALIDAQRWEGPVGVGFPAAIHHGVVRTAANVDASFAGLSIADYFSERTGHAVSVLNDADAAGLAEVRFGAARDVRGVVLVATIGTGIGTALFTDGRLLPNTELGHILLDNGVEAERYASEAARVRNKLGWAAWGKRFDRYLKAMEKLFWPDLIVLGGGVSRRHEKFAPFLTTSARVVPARYFNRAGIIGAGIHAEDRGLRTEDRALATLAS